MLTKYLAPAAAYLSIRPSGSNFSAVHRGMMSL
jgi:hypothetical protein